MYNLRRFCIASKLDLVLEVIIKNIVKHKYVEITKRNKKKKFKMQEKLDMGNSEYLGKRRK